MRKSVKIALAISVFLLVCMCGVAILCVASAPLAMWTDGRSIGGCLDNNPQVLLLKSYVSDKTLENMNPDFYTYLGFRDWWRYPLVYPYSINAIDTLDYGFLEDESAVMSYRSSANDGIQLIHGIERFTFDQNYMLIERSSDFVLFDFGRGEWEEFETREALIEEAEKLNFEGEYEFMTLRDIVDPEN